MKRTQSKKTDKDFTPIELLARQLSINHYNVSVSNGNVDYEQKLEHVPDYEHILTSNAIINNKSELGYSRNILIVGAGASKSIFDTIMAATEAVNNIYNQFNVFDLLQHTSVGKEYDLYKKFIHEVNKLSGFVYHDKVIGKSEKDKSRYIVNRTKEIINSLSFEENLAVLQIFFRRDEIINKIKLSVGAGFSYLPSLLYENIAHLFKHRFIDVIINMNFDELLDNAIDDAMGESTYHKVIDDVNCEPLSNISDKSRLRKPIYIKPHGSLYSKSSIRFTKEHYLDHSNEMKELLDDIFLGKVGDEINHVKRLNVIMMGYGLYDIDIQNILYSQYIRLKKKKLKEINYFIFNTNPDDVEKRLVENLSYWETPYWLRNDNSALSKHYNRLKKELDDRNNYNIYSIKCNKSNYAKTELKDQRTLGWFSEKLYDSIRECFKYPFKPKETFRHELLTTLFPRNILNQELTTTAKNNSSPLLKPDVLIRNRAVVAVIYEIIIHKGVVPLHCIISGRGGKYLSIYNSLFHKGEKPFSIINTINSALRKHDRKSDKLKLGTCKLEGAYLFFKTLNDIKDTKTREDEIKRILAALIQIMISFSSIDMHSDIEEVTKHFVKNLFDKVSHTKYFEINAIYNFSEYHKFYSFTNKQIIPTNLNLTWRLYYFAKNLDFDRICMLDDTGKALLNLDGYADKGTSYIFNKYVKTIELICTDLDVYIKNKVGGQKGKKYLDRYGSRKYISIREVLKEYGGSIKSIDRNLINHRIVLFYKGKIILAAIYFYMPSAVVRVTPIWIERTQDINTKKDLEIIESYFKQVKARAE